MSAYYNEIDPFCVSWLRNLIKAGLIASGDVDDRPIQEVRPADVAGYNQCHFFAGIGGWSHAARLAGWPDGRPLWTGSCPCQPFSVAGRRKGIKDKRHLWPHFYRLIRTSRPALVMGEQTSGTPGYAWLDGVGADLEAEAYAWRAVDIPACSVNSPEIRNRIYWLACAGSSEWRPTSEGRGHVNDRPDSGWKEEASGSELGGSLSNRMAGSDCPNPERAARQRPRHGQTKGAGPHDQPSGRSLHAGSTGRLDGTPSTRFSQAEPGEVETLRNRARWVESERRSGDGGACRLGGADLGGLHGPGLHVLEREPRQAGSLSPRPSESGFWDDWQLIGPDPEGKYRRIKPGITPLDTRLPGDVGQIRGYGNAINPELAAEVIRAYMEAEA